LTADPNTWIDKYGDYLFSLAFLKVRNRETAEDLVQDTFVSAIKALHKFKGESSEKTWLVAILNNKIIDHVRKKDVLKNVDSYLSETDAAFHEAFFETHPGRYGHWLSRKAPAALERADQLLEDEMFSSVLPECLSRLPVKLSLVFTARFLDEKESEIICKDFNITPSNYWVIVHRAKVLVRACLEEKWFS
jgi:RNA polymerase sigma-70 factor (TIGR02943 family)